MASDGPTLTDCNREIYKHGRGVCVVDGRPRAVEKWVKAVAEKADAQVDWHYSGGRANVLHLGDDESRERVLKVIKELESELDGDILSIGGPALYRRGVEDPDATGARIQEVDGKTVLVDPEAMGIIRAVAKRNCQNTLKVNADRVKHFKGRFAARGLKPTDAIIIIANVDDAHGGLLADALMPGQNWQEIRDRGETPFARGLAMRSGIQGALETFDKQAAAKLQKMTKIAVVVVDHGVAEIFPA